MYTYLLINISIISLPLILSFDKKVSFYRKFLNYLFSVSIVSTFFILWDIIAVERGDWSFNPEYLTGISILNLPVEEILFFITVPYGCIFIYETLLSYFKEKHFELNKYFLIAPAVLFFVVGILFINQAYTATVLFVCSAILIVPVLLNYKLIRSNLFWIAIIVSYLPFFIFNYMLTSLPVVKYNPYAIWEIRLTTIPIEDFLYSFSMVYLWIVFYEYSKKFIKEV